MKDVYNTGKVLIGLHYQPRKQGHMNGNNIYWQEVLLGKRRSLLQRLIDLWRDLDAKD